MKCSECLHEEGCGLDWVKLEGTEHDKDPVHCSKCKSRVEMEFCPMHKYWYESLCEGCEEIEIKPELYKGRLLR